MSSPSPRPSLGRFLYSSLGACAVGFVVLGILTIACALYAQSVIKLTPLSQPPAGSSVAPGPGTFREVDPSDRLRP